MSKYQGREQTEAKHFILEKYLQALAFKVMRSWDITYVDGFSGPWQSQTADFSDTSFMIAIAVLKDAQAQIKAQTGVLRKVKCFFSETDVAAFAQLQAAVAPHHNPAEGFEVHTYHGKFEDAASQIQSLIGRSFPLIFIDPTGWTGYPFSKIRSLFQYEKCEVIINFMYDFINRAAGMSDPKTVASLDPILGGPGWVSRLDPSLDRGPGVEKLFRDTLKREGSFEFVVSTRVDRATKDRPHFFLAYGTKNRSGLIAFRQIEYEALRVQARSRANAKERKREETTKTPDLFAGSHADVQEAGIDDIVEAEKQKATSHLLELLAVEGAVPFADVVVSLLQPYILRETNVKDICVRLADQGKIVNTWGDGRNKPKDTSEIRLA
ncbi:three-Cys-motif partner protein TcmP [Rhizobium leguminosarum]|uniref:three-Cys-motif partner protein TcmP n=1 Tax=Rhizobium ruizarguesonis TaxID=2081791 RepID=UPI0013CC0D55|nr:three-Cys-motif partner protein TcmP [Rhizobium ruizarguesonis]NEJ60794.1 three-Cys-motif partner protein TcmP [Rhizobium ruizarguesonis]